MVSRWLESLRRRGSDLLRVDEPKPGPRSIPLTRTELPLRPGGVFPDQSGRPGQLDLSAAEGHYAARQVAKHGLVGYGGPTLACWLAVLDHVQARCCFDVGANIGVFALTASAVTDADVVAFEPTPDLAAVCRAVVERNQLGTRVEEVALGEEPGSALLYLSDRSDVSNSLAAGYRPSSRQVEVEVTTIDRFSEDHSLAPEVMKIDTETTEPAVIRGASGTIRQHRPWIICEVLPAQTERDLEQIFGDLDYRWYQITGENRLVPRREIFGDRGGRFRDWLFAPYEPPESLWNDLAAWKKVLRNARERGRW